MNKDTTTIRIQKTTSELLKAVAARRGRRETMDQILMELIEQYIRNKNA